MVCVTGPLLHLIEAGAVHLLQNAGRMLIPEVVAAKFEQNAQGWMEKEEINPAEAEAIALALQVKRIGC